MLPAIMNRGRAVTSVGLDRAPEAGASWGEVGDIQIGHLQADEGVWRVFALRDELVDDFLAVVDELQRVGEFAVVRGNPVGVGFQAIEHSPSGSLSLGELLVERREFWINRHLEFGTELTFEAAGPLIDLQPHALAGRRLAYIEAAAWHVVAGGRSRVGRRCFVLSF